MSADVPGFVLARRSIRRFSGALVDDDVLAAAITAACLAPAPHHSRPWRFVTLGAHGRRRLAHGMAEAWRADLERDGVAEGRVEALLEASRERMEAAPAAILGCLTWEGLDRYADEARHRAEWGMALLSLGAAVQNLMLTLTDAGLASCWIAAPIFCPDAAAQALDLEGMAPQALVLVGHPHPDYVAFERPSVDLGHFALER